MTEETTPTTPIDPVDPVESAGPVDPVDPNDPGDHVAVADEPAPTKRWVIGLLLALATLVTVMAILAVWTKRQVLEEGNWMQTSSALLADPVVRDRVADYLVDQLYENVDVEGAIQPLLPDELQRLAGPISSGLRELVDKAANAALARPAVQEAWRFANQTAHRALTAAIEGDYTAISESDGYVVLDLGVVLKEVSETAGIGGRVADKIPEGAAQLKIMSADNIDNVRKMADLLKVLAFVLTAIALILYIVAIYLARGYRVKAMAATGVSLIFAGTIALVLRDWLGETLVHDLVDSAETIPAALASWQIATGVLEETSTGVLATGVAMLLAAFLGSGIQIAKGVRRTVVPLVRDPYIYSAAVFGFLLLLLAWKPIEALGRPLLAPIVLALLAGGAYAWRRQILSENPPAQAPDEV